ncbi:MAG TPA: hypothetical protein VFU16_02955 [Solirubrobacterales bacterium]|nr:hypothetical protein [Solirubrobacterales bacterium]
MKRARLTLIAVALAAFAAVPLAAGAGSKPPTGAWTLGPGSGFSLVNGKGSQKGKLVLVGLHAKLGSECTSAPGATVKVLGRYPLKQFRRGGYSAWGVGKDAGGEPTYMNAQVVLGGDTVQGSFYLLWDYSNPSKVFRGGIKAGSCGVEFTSGKPK